MSFQPTFDKLTGTDPRLAYPTDARPVYDPTVFMRIMRDNYEDAEDRLEAYFRRQGEQYQARDWRSHDYDLTLIRGVSYPIRGPVPDVLEDGRYFVVLGSAASFGARAHRPYGQRLADKIGMPCLNLSKSGIGPEWLLARYETNYAQWIEGAAFVVVEATSARSVSNSAYEMLPDGTKARTRNGPSGEVVKINREIRDLYLNGKAEDASALITESLNNYETLTRRLVDKISCPTALIYLSRRDPGNVNRRNLHRKPRAEAKQFLSSHPHYVDRTALRRIAKSVEVVECVTDSGLPSRAVNRFTGASEMWHRIDPNGNVKGDPIESQTYYPSDDMHADACAALLETDVVRPFDKMRYEREEAI